MRRSIRIYVEGGGETNAVSAPLRRGLQTFLADARLAAAAKSYDFKIIPCGGRDAAYKDFVTALSLYPNDVVILLVDSEDPPVAAPEGHAAPTWYALQQRDGWVRPPNVDDTRCYLMVNAMEAWLIADTTALAAFYKAGFNAAKLPSLPNIEAASRHDLVRLLRVATAQCAKTYHKAHAFELIGRARTGQVARLPSGGRFINGLTQILEAL